MSRITNLNIIESEYAKDGYVSKAAHYGAYYEIVLSGTGIRVPVIFGCRRHGIFVYFPSLEEGINISEHECESETADKLTYLFDNNTSEAIADRINHFIGKEGILNKIRELATENRQLRDDIRGLIAEEVSKYDPDWGIKY